MFLILFNMLLIGLYLVIGFIVLCIIAVIWELVEKLFKLCKRKQKSAKIPYGNKGQFIEFISYDLKNGG